MTKDTCDKHGKEDCMACFYTTPPVTPNQERGACCRLCYEYLSGVQVCGNTDCDCHTPQEPSEKRIEHKDQVHCKNCVFPPNWDCSCSCHTRTEKENYERDHSHFHCWESNDPPCGIKGEHRCCLCEKPVPTKEKECCENGLKKAGAGTIPCFDHSTTKEKEPKIEMVSMTVEPEKNLDWPTTNTEKVEMEQSYTLQGEPIGNVRFNGFEYAPTNTSDERKKKIEAGAKDFAERFEPVMRELADEEKIQKGLDTLYSTTTSDDWESEIVSLVGEASMCWEPIPTGVFDSDEAMQVAFKIVKIARNELEKAREEGVGSQSERKQQMFIAGRTAALEEVKRIVEGMKINLLPSQRVILSAEIGHNNALSDLLSKLSNLK